MRRDICCTYPKSPSEVYNAYLQAIKQVFGKDGEGIPCHTLSFGLNFSFKYNMNGGSCTVHLMPYNGGTAVDVRYSIAQLMGAMYTRHCKDMTDAVEKLLGCTATAVEMDVEQFLKPEIRSALLPRRSRLQCNNPTRLQPRRASNFARLAAPSSQPMPSFAPIAESNRARFPKAATA